MERILECMVDYHQYHTLSGCGQHGVCQLQVGQSDIDAWKAFIRENIDSQCDALDCCCTELSGFIAFLKLLKNYAEIVETECKSKIEKLEEVEKAMLRDGTYD